MQNAFHTYMSNESSEGQFLKAKKKDEFILINHRSTHNHLSKEEQQFTVYLLANYQKIASVIRTSRDRSWI